jgi:hypothetical protein
LIFQEKHTTCYRKTKWLLNEGLVIVDSDGSFLPEGNTVGGQYERMKSSMMIICNNKELSNSDHQDYLEQETRRSSLIQAK